MRGASASCQGICGITRERSPRSLRKWNGTNGKGTSSTRAATGRIDSGFQPLRESHTKREPQRARRHTEESPSVSSLVICFFQRTLQPLKSPLTLVPAHIAGQGSNDDQSMPRWNSSLGGKIFLKVNANSVGPCASRCAMRFLASSMPGTWPAGTHHRAR